MIKNCSLLLASFVSSSFADYGTHSGPDGWVNDHNHFRCKHGADPVSWDLDLANKARTWAEHLDNNGGGLQHSNTYSIWPVSGENLAWGYGTHSCNGVTEPFGQHCSVWNWYKEYSDLWNCNGGSSGWKTTGGLGHFTAMIWKGVDLIGCHQSGRNIVCNYGSKFCKDKTGNPECTSSMPPHLPNFNINKCPGDGTCVSCLDSNAKCAAVTTTAQPSATLPPATTTKPATTTLKPSTKPATTTLKPSTKPATTTLKPSTKPATTTLKPSTKPATTTLKPSTKPATTTLKPSTKPSTTTLQPSTKPPTTTLKPSTKPATTTSQPKCSRWGWWMAHVGCSRTVGQGSYCDFKQANPRCKNSDIPCACVERPTCSGEGRLAAHKQCASIRKGSWCKFCGANPYCVGTMPKVACKCME